MKKVLMLFAVVAFCALFIAPALLQAAPAAPPVEKLDVGLSKLSSTGLGGQNADLREVVGSIIKVALSFLGVVAIIIVLIGGFKYMTAGGSDEKVAEARKWIISGIIGVAIILAAYAITSFVIDRLVKATGGIAVD